MTFSCAIESIHGEHVDNVVGKQHARDFAHYKDRRADMNSDLAIMFSEKAM